MNFQAEQHDKVLWFERVTATIIMVPHAIASEKSRWMDYFMLVVLDLFRLGSGRKG